MERKYWLTERPPAPGAFPSEGVLEVHGFDSRTYSEEAHGDVWGWVLYDRQLTDRETACYELSEPRQWFPLKMVRWKAGSRAGQRDAAVGDPEVHLKRPADVRKNGPENIEMTCWYESWKVAWRDRNRFLYRQEY